jgi:predicted aspartyl protease
MRASLSIAPVLFAFAGFISPVSAENCRPLTEIASIDLHLDGRTGSVYLPVTINGHEKSMALDTGGSFSIVTQDAVDEFGLPVHATALRQFDINGRSSDEAATVSDFAMGALHGKDVEFMVSVDPHLFRDDDGVAGIVGPNILHAYDVEIDFGAMKLKLISPDHCEGKVVYWPASAVAVIPVEITQGWQIVVPVTLDGYRYNALIDTGAFDTVLSARAARADFGLGLHGLRRRFARFPHKFQSLDFEGVTIANPTILILRDLPSDRFRDESRTGTRFGGAAGAPGVPDLLIGMDVLKHLHVYISYVERKLYITPANEPPAPGADAPAESSTP